MLRMFSPDANKNIEKICSRNFKWRYMSHELPEDPDVKDDIRFHYL